MKLTSLTMRKQFASLVKANQWWQADQPIVVAVSTGVDSMVLLDLLQHLRTHRPQIIVAHVNHELRDASVAEQAYLTNYCEEHQLKLVVAHWHRDEHPTNGVEEAARQFRYAFFERVMRENHATVLLTAHHQNDQAETVLMKLMRAGDLTQVRGIQPQRPFADGKLIRPLLTFPKAELVQYAESEQIKWFDDQTNADDDVTRNRIRHHLLPQMEQENPKIIAGLSRFATELDQTLAANHFMVMKLLAEMKGTAGYDLTTFVKVPETVQIQMLMAIDSELAGHRPLNNKQLHMMVNILNNHQKPQGDFKINSAITLQKSYASFKLQFSKNVEKNTVKINQIMVRLNHWYRIDNRITIGVFKRHQAPKLKGAHVISFRLNPDCFPLLTRQWRPTDKINLRLGGHQKVTRVLIDQKVSIDKRAQARVLVDQHGRVLSLLGYKDSFLNDEDHDASEYQLLIRT